MSMASWLSDPYRVASRNVTVELFPLTRFRAAANTFRSSSRMNPTTTGFWQHEGYGLTYKQLFEELSLAFRYLDFEPADGPATVRARQIALVCLEQSPQPAHFVRMWDENDEFIPPGNYCILLHDHDAHLGTPCAFPSDILARPECCKPLELELSDRATIIPPQTSTIHQFIERSPAGAPCLIETVHKYESSIAFWDRFGNVNAWAQPTDPGVFVGLNPAVAFCAMVAHRDRVCCLTGQTQRDGCTIEACHIIPTTTTGVWNEKLELAVWASRYVGFKSFPEPKKDQLSINSPENGFYCGADLHDLFDNFFWSVEPETQRIRVFVDLPELKPFHGQPIERFMPLPMQLQSSEGQAKFFWGPTTDSTRGFLSNNFLAGRPPSLVWEWHYTQCVLRCLRASNRIITPLPDLDQDLLLAYPSRAPSPSEVYWSQPLPHQLKYALPTIPVFRGLSEEKSKKLVEEFVQAALVGSGHILLEVSSGMKKRKRE